LQCTDLLVAGEHPWIAAWTFYEPELTPRTNTSVAATTLAGAGPTGPTAPLAELALVLGGEQAGCWRINNPEQVRQIPPELLAAIRDGEIISSKVREGRALDAYVQTIVLANETSAAGFAKAARRDVGFANVFHHPGDYRGQVIHVEGRLRLIQKDDAPDMLRLAGIRTLYFAWVFDDLSGDNPYCVVVTEPPANLPVNQKINQQVSFDGYYYMNRRYKAEDSKKPNEARVAPLFIGHSLIVPPAPPAPAENGTEWPKGMLWSFLGLAAAVMLFVGGLGYWFRWHDTRTQRRLTATRRFVEPEANAEEPAAWPVPAEPQA
jgi:hypothetical protein